MKMVTLLAGLWVLAGSMAGTAVAKADGISERIETIRALGECYRTLEATSNPALRELTLVRPWVAPGQTKYFISTKYLNGIRYISARGVLEYGFPGRWLEKTVSMVMATGDPSIDRRVIQLKLRVAQDQSTGFKLVPPEHGGIDEVGRQVLFSETGYRPLYQENLDMMIRDGKGRKEIGQWFSGIRS